MTKLILVRHCQSEGNLEKFFQGTIDTDITDVGFDQINRTAVLLKNEHIDVIYSSPKKRALKSAKGINVYHNVDIKTDERLCEIDAGLWEGILLENIQKTFPQAYDKWKNDPANFAAPGGETMTHVYERVSAAVKDIVSQNKEKTICIVSHGCAIRNMMCYAHGWSIDRIGELTIGENMTVNIISFDDALRPHILMEGYSSHLDN